MKKIITEAVKKIDAINNIIITKKEGLSLIAYYVKGTNFAMDRAVEILKENNINFSINNSHSYIGFSINKKIN